MYSSGANQIPRTVFFAYYDSTIEWLKFKWVHIYLLVSFFSSIETKFELYLQPFQSEFMWTILYFQTNKKSRLLQSNPSTMHEN